MKHAATERRDFAVNEHLHPHPLHTGNFPTVSYTHFLNKNEKSRIIRHLRKASNRKCRITSKRNKCRETEGKQTVLKKHARRKWTKNS